MNDLIINYEHIVLTETFSLDNISVDEIDINKRKLLIHTGTFHGVEKKTITYNEAFSDYFTHYFLMQGMVEDQDQLATYLDTIITACGNGQD